MLLGAKGTSTRNQKLLERKKLVVRPGAPSSFLYLLVTSKSCMLAKMHLRRPL